MRKLLRRIRTIAGNHGRHKTLFAKLGLCDSVRLNHIVFRLKRHDVAVS